MEQTEQAAITAAECARDAAVVAIDAYRAAGFGSHVTQPLCHALDLIRHSINEVGIKPAPFVLARADQAFADELSKVRDPLPLKGERV